MGSFVRLNVDLFALLDKDLPNFHLTLKTPKDWNKSTKIDNHVPYLDYLDLYSDRSGKKLIIIFLKLNKCSSSIVQIPKLGSQQTTFKSFYAALEPGTARSETS